MKETKVTKETKATSRAGIWQPFAAVNRNRVSDTSFDMASNIATSLAFSFTLAGVGHFCVSPLTPKPLDF